MSGLSLSVSFGAPLWFWAFMLITVLAGLFFWNEKRRAELLRRLVAARLQPELTASVSTRQRRLRFFTLLLGVSCVILALAQPRWGYTFEQAKRKGRDMIIAIDTSKSMLANDLQPSRLTRAKLAAQDLINALPGDRVGLIAFAGNAFLQAPLTIDYAAVTSAVNELDTNIIPRGGTDIAAAIKVAADAFGKGESSNRALIIFTDGEELEESAVVAARAQAQNFRIFTVGVGSKEGALIPVPDERGGTTFVKDEQGQYVKSRLDESRLTEIASASGGFYVQLQNGPETMKQIIEQGLGKMQEHEIDARQSRRPIERYQWPLALGLILVAGSTLIRESRRVNGRARPLVGTKKRVAVSAAAGAAFLLLFPAIGWSRNEGVELYEKQNYKGAYDTFQKQLSRNPKSDALQFDAGAAAYKSGDFDKALDAFSKAVTTRDPQVRQKAEYNLANTLFQRGAKQNTKDQKIKEWRNALQHYEQALNADPKDENAKYNRDLVKKLIEEMEKEPPKQQEQKQDQQQKNDQKDQQQQQQSSGQDQQKQQQKNEQNKDQQKSGQQQQKQDQNSQQPQQQEKNSGSSKDKQQQDQRQNGEPKDEQENQGKQGQQQQAQQGGKPDDQQQQQASQDNQPDSKNQQGQSAGNEDRVAPQQTPSGEKFSGDIHAQGQAGDKDKSDDKNAEAAIMAEPVKPGEMNEAQARALIESLRGEDDHVLLQERKGSAPVLKDW